MSGLPASRAAGDATLFGVNPQRVIELLRDRAERPASERLGDGRRVGLVIEGGSLRGVMSAGGLMALCRMGMDRVFDHVLATSAGVMNGAYFLSGQPDLGITIYFEELASTLFINARRLWKILDLDYVFDEVVVKLKPLDLEALRRSTTKFSVTMIDKNTASGLLVDAVHGPAPTLTCLKAATAIPVLYNRAVMVGDKPCIDGGLLKPLPLKDAIADGCTDILVLMTQPATYARQHVPWFARLAFDVLCARGRRDLGRLIRNYPAVDDEVRQLALGKMDVPRGVNIATICPAEEETIHGMHIDGEALWTAACQYCTRTLRIFGKPEIEPGIAPPRSK